MRDRPGSDGIRIVRGASPALRAYAFALYERGLRQHIAAAFGWDEAKQRARFARSYPDDELHRIRRGDATVGILALRSGASLHVALLLIHPRWQRRGIGRAVMALVAAEAARSGRAITLSVFRSNASARALYAALGYAEVAGDDVFLELRWTPRAAPD